MLRDRKIIWNEKNLNNSIGYHNEKNTFKLFVELVEYKTNRTGILHIKLSYKYKLGIAFEKKKDLVIFLDNEYEKLFEFIINNFKYNQNITQKSLELFDNFFNKVRWFLTFQKNGKQIIKNLLIEMIVSEFNYRMFINRKYEGEI